jgi:hypothetical protein
MRCRIVKARTSAIACVVIMACGCGGAPSNMAEVKGKVLLDGKPLSTGSVVTMPERGPGANGIINEQGEFNLTTRERGMGASLGRHQVGVAAFEESTNWSPEAPQKSLIPQKYASPETSGLSIEVKPDEPNEVVLELSSKP